MKSGSLCALPQRNCSESKTHSWLLECDSGQAIQAQSSNPNRVVPLSTGVQSIVCQVGPAPSGFVCDPVQSQNTKVCVSGSGSDSLGDRCPEPAVGSVGCLRLSPLFSDLPGNVKVEGSGLLQNDPNCPRMAEHALVLGPSESISSDPVQASSDTVIPDLVTQPFNGLLHWNLTHLNLHAWLLESSPSKSAGSLKRWQQELRLLREAQPELYISQSGPFLQNGTNHTRWTSGPLLEIRSQSSSYIFLRRETCSPVLSRVTGQPLPTWWAMIN